MTSRVGQWLASTLILALTFGGTWGFVVMGFGSCPEPEVMKGFDITRYMGRWFEYVRFPNTFEMGSKCVTANYTLKADGSVRVVNAAIQESSYGLGLCPWYESTIADGNAVIVDKNETAKLGVRFSEYSPRGNYWVLETDYVTYSVVYGCSSFTSMAYIQNAWILTRERGVAPKDLTGIYVRMGRQGLDPSNFEEPTDHKGCPDWPNPN